MSAPLTERLIEVIAQAVCSRVSPTEVWPALADDLQDIYRDAARNALSAVLALLVSEAHRLRADLQRREGS